MLSIKHILTPVDFSERSEAAVIEATRLAELFGANLTVMHVEPSLEAHAAYRGLAQVEQSEKTQLEASRRAEAQLRGFAAKLAPKASTVLAEGDPLTRIEEHAKNHAVDLIVIGTHGRGGFRRFLLGSLASKLLHDMSIPMATGAHLADHAVAPLKIAHVGCALGLDNMDDCGRILRWAGDLAQLVGAKLTVIHVPHDIDPGSFTDPETSKAQRDNAAKHIAALCEKTGVTADVVIEGGAAMDTVAEILAAKHCDALVIGRTGQQGLFRIGHADGYALIRRSPVPVFSV
ncbi:MAG: universal stress protein [Acidobacteria bacterium]|nr:universal stress protein [Acidobacteriota bacterium]